MLRLHRTAAVAAVMFFAFTACNATHETPASGTNTPGAPAAPAAPAAPTVPTSGSRGPTTDPTLKNADGTTFVLADVPGKAKVLNFWATWCAPCIGEMPILNAMSEKYKAKDVTFVAVSLDEGGSADVDRLLKSGKVKVGFRIAYASLEDKPFGVDAPIPDTLVFDAKNRLVKHFDKVIEPGELEAAINEALANGAN
jgi:thiol-disulfide isomerase/thioredoxin